MISLKVLAKMEQLTATIVNLERNIMRNIQFYFADGFASPAKVAEAANNPQVSQAEVRRRLMTQFAGSPQQHDPLHIAEDPNTGGPGANTDYYYDDMEVGQEQAGQQGNVPTQRISAARNPPRIVQNSKLHMNKYDKILYILIQSMITDNYS